MLVIILVFKRLSNLRGQREDCRRWSQAQAHPKTFTEVRLGLCEVLVHVQIKSGIPGSQASSQVLSIWVLHLLCCINYDGLIFQMMHKVLSAFMRSLTESVFVLWSDSNMKQGLFMANNCISVNTACNTCCFSLPSIPWEMASSFSSENSSWMLLSHYMWSYQEWQWNTLLAPCHTREWLH